MRPTAQEQLQGTCRILETVVAPCVADPLARTLLDGLVANLRMLTEALPAVPAFLRSDNQATAELLATLRGVLSADLVARIDAALQAPEPDVADGAALEEHNRCLRELLALAVCNPDLQPSHHRQIVQHMGLRASRVPMRYVATAPSPPPSARS